MIIVLHLVIELRIFIISRLYLITFFGPLLCRLYRLFIISAKDLIYVFVLDCDVFMNALQIISPYDLYLNPRLVLQKYEIWRLATNFLYFGKLGTSFSLEVFCH